MSETESTALRVRGLRAWYGQMEALHGIDVDVPRLGVTAIIGPSGCGKSTFIRCLNRMHELIRGARVEGTVELDGQDIHGAAVDPVLLRRRIGMVFQKPNPFPNMTIRQNVLAGLTLTRQKTSRADQDALVREALEGAALWDEVKDRLDSRGSGLSGGQQQRLCIARALAVKPEILLMDEPCSALDPIATARIEELLSTLRSRYTIVIVTHNMQQAARVSQQTAFFLQGDLIEFTETDRLFTKPDDQRTEDYITGKFG
jgi:phosphate transport system ATP-binding protein